MADEKPPATPPAEEHHDDAGPIQRPPGWMYKGFRIFGVENWYASPSVQLIMVSMVCFLCPGMFNALSGMGGMGLKDLNAAAQANTALYSTFAVVAFFAGTIANVIGLRLTMAIGGIGYCVYIASFLCYAHTENNPFVIFAGAFLGVCAGLLWTAQGAIMMAYPTEARKGRYIAWFWMIFNSGAVIGSLVSSLSGEVPLESQLHIATCAHCCDMRPLPLFPANTHSPRSPSRKPSITRARTSTTAPSPPSSFSPSAAPSSPCRSATPTTSSAATAPRSSS
jgi:hypothetical protein